MSERITYVEVDLDRCSNTYGIAPCAASLSGNEKCFNCLATCQDTPNYSSETVTQRYSTVSSKVPVNIDAIPCISSVKIRPAKVDLGESIGVRASVDISLVDFRSPDTGPDGDRYLSNRTYDPYTRGTYFGKFRARYPFTKGTDLRVIRGYTDQTLATMETRHFVVDSLAGPTSGGAFSITCKDGLKLASGKKAQAPLLSAGELSADITDVQTSITLNPVGVGPDYPSSGIVNVGGKELCDFTRSGDLMTITRGQYNTEAKEHKDGARVQLCLQYSGDATYTIFNDLLQNYAGIPASYIPLNDWINEHDSYIQRAYSTIIAEPTSVTDLINEILQQTASSMWWDDVSRLIIFRVLRGVLSTAPSYADDEIKGGTFSAKDQPKKRVSQVWTYYGQLDPTQKLNEKSNYSNTLLTISTESESNYGESAIKSIFSRWIISTAKNAAERLNDLILQRYTDPPRLISLTLQRGSDLTTPQIGGTYNINNWTLQDATGATTTVPVQAVQVNTSDTNYAVLAEEVLYSQTIAPSDPNIKPIAIDADTNNVNILDLFNEIYGIPAATDIVTVTVSEAATIGSLSPFSDSLVTGVGWPIGSTLKLVNNGVIAGKGGSGGGGGYFTPLPFFPDVVLRNGLAGGMGGDAISLNHDLEIVNNGVIGSGGGGGGGGGAAYSFTPTPSNSYIKMSGGGGGAGAGQTSSSGGAGGSNSVIGPLYFYTGAAGTLSVAQTSGLGGAGGVYTPSYSLGNAGNGGNGSGLGVAGLAGVNGVPSTTGRYTLTSAGGSGGATGNAIIKNGNTLTYSGNAALGAVI